ncbi:hypothetical protein BDV06DRAFT_188240 [Aspergillus oleicola]
MQHVCASACMRFRLSATVLAPVRLYLMSITIATRYSVLASPCVYYSLGTGSPGNCVRERGDFIVGLGFLCATVGGTYSLGNPRCY